VPEENNSEAPRRALHSLVLGLTFPFAILALAAASALIVHTVWTRGLENGAFAVAVATARIAMNWLVWKDEEEK
jgi:uncharacterized membrane protein YqjE